MAKNLKFLVKIVLFVLLAIPGALVSVFSGIILFGKVLSPDKFPGHPLMLISLCFLGALFVIIGIGKYREWLYVLVFFSMPLAFLMYSFINPMLIGGMIPFLLFVAGSAGAVYSCVKKYYAIH